MFLLVTSQTVPNSHSQQTFYSLGILKLLDSDCRHQRPRDKIYTYYGRMTSEGKMSIVMLRLVPVVGLDPESDISA